MSRQQAGIFSTWAPIYREQGYWARPITYNTKICHEKQWQRPDTEIPPEELEEWLREYRRYGIGLVMGSPFPDGSRLGALDIDRNEYEPLGRAVLRDPPCGRIGSKGAVFFVRVTGAIRNAEFRVRGDENGKFGKVAECLFDRRLCVIPPTIHPDTKAPYRWIGTPLHELDFSLLPLVEM